jgi:hypothetical protein
LIRNRGESPSGKAPGFGPGMRGFESLLPSQQMRGMRFEVKAMRAPRDFAETKNADCEIKAKPPGEALFHNEASIPLFKQMRGWRSEAKAKIQLRESSTSLPASLFLKVYSAKIPYTLVNQKKMKDPNVHLFGEELKKKPAKKKKLGPRDKVITEKPKEKEHETQVADNDTHKKQEQKDYQTNQPEPEIIVFNKREKHRGGEIIGLIFLSAGVVLLLNYADLLSWDFWEEILVTWPIILILVGIQIILGSNWFSRIITFFLALAAFLLIISYGIIQVESPLAEYLPYQVSDFINSINQFKK